MSESKSKIKCKKGEVTRVGYKRKGYERRGYKKKDGTVIKPTYVSKSVVSEGCIKDKGKLGKGPKTLPDLRKEIKLRRYGYSVHKSTKERHDSLMKAAKDFGVYEVLKHLNLARNKQAESKNKDIMSQDVKFLSKMYAPISKTRRKNQRGGGEFGLETDEWFKNEMDQLNQNNKYGGQDNTIPESIEESEVKLEDADYSGNSSVKINTIYDQEKVCDSNGKCGVRNQIYEKHKIDGKKIEFYTLGEKDADDILELDSKYYNSDYIKSDVIEKIRDNRGLLIGIRVDDVLEGYCMYDPYEDKGVLGVKIIWFVANKGFGTPLYIFIEKFFKRVGYKIIKLNVSIEGSYSTRRLNFWYDKDFRAYQTIADKKWVLMEKQI